jgi:hypothetical protein
MDEKTTTSTPMAPLQTTVIGVGDSDQRYLPSGTRAVTASPHQPDVILTVISPLLAILIRFGNIFCLTLAGALTAGGLSGTVIPHADFLAMVRPAIFLASCTAGVGFLKDLATIFSGLEKKFPLATGNV